MNDSLFMSNYEILYIVGIVCAVIAGAFLIATIIIFFRFNIPTLLKDRNGTLEQKQIQEIRLKNSTAANRRGKINVFEELEKKAKVKRNNTQSLNLSFTTTHQRRSTANSEFNPGTTVLQKNIESTNSNFIIEKNIMFVSTNEVML